MRYPPDAELKVEYCLYGMYTACISRSIKDRILESFTKPDGKIRFLVATTAFAFGVNAPKYTLGLFRLLR